MIATVLLAAGLTIAPPGPSFPCRTPAHLVERLICADPALAARDGEMARRYAMALTRSNNPAALRRMQGRALLRRDRCADAACLIRWYDRRNAALRPPLGACTDTMVAAVGSRLEATPGSGSLVTYSDGRIAVADGAVPAMAAAKVGDPVRVCLVSRPMHCPAGDDRGALWKALDRRSGASWTQADSSHLCGGA